MSDHATHEPNGVEAAARETLVDGLRNAHALEKQAITVMESQLDLLTEFPELHARITEHVTETRDQARRLEAGLEACGESTSVFKDALLSVMGFGQSSVQGFADDAVLKAVLADTMTEHLEIATYRTLISLADMAGKPDLRPRLEETLREEEAMAAWLDQNLDAITHRYIELMAAEQRAEAAGEEARKAEDDTHDGEGPRTPWYARDEDAGQTRKADASLGMTPDKPEATPAGQAFRNSGT